MVDAKSVGGEAKRTQPTAPTRPLTATAYPSPPAGGPQRSSMVVVPFALCLLGRSDARMTTLVVASAVGAAGVTLLGWVGREPIGLDAAPFVATLALDAAVLAALLALGAAAGRRLRSLTPVPEDHAIRADFAGPELPPPPDALATAP